MKSKMDPGLRRDDEQWLDPVSSAIHGLHGM